MRRSTKGSPRLFHGGSEAFLPKLTPNLLHHGIREGRNTAVMISSRICREMLRSPLERGFCVHVLSKVVGNLPSLQEIHCKHMHRISELYGPLPSRIMSAVSSSGINSMSSFFTLIVINRPFPATHVIFEVYCCYLLPFEGLGVCFLTLVSRFL